MQKLVILFLINKSYKSVLIYLSLISCCIIKPVVMALQIYSWYASFPTWNETSFDHVRDFNQPPPPGVDYQQYNMSTSLPIQSSYNNPVHSVYTSQLPYTPQQLYANTSYANYLPRNNENTNVQMIVSSNSYIFPQPEIFSSSSEHYRNPKSNKSKKRKGRRGKKKKAVVDFACLNSKIKNQPSCTVNNDKLKKKKKNVLDDGGDESIVQNKGELAQQFYREKKNPELETKPIKAIKKELNDNVTRPTFSFSTSKQSLKNNDYTCIAMRLPLEIFVKIVEYSTAETTLALTFTCRKWYIWLTDEKSAYIDQAWRRSRKNTHPRRRKPKNGVREMVHTIQKMKPKPEWFYECDMCYKKSNVMKWQFRDSLVRTCYNCKKMYEISDSQKN
ncbi:hypothetical protein RclHR1_13750001 [Rhizophagus clarus]|uniref:F-box domain-containing protein n=1 Tax=Rhizophagus clarus TaxID=94130 RepID=A0A2Z6R3F7_9GLOM|nr:hypothetical protein RclHR1_13750001 [Rhizophagus clarus]